MNKKVRSSRSKTVSDLLKPSEPAKMRQLQTRSRDLNAEIQRLECTIASAPALMRRQRLATIDSLPPLRSPERPAPRGGKATARKMPLHKQREQRRRRVGLLVELALVFTTLAAALGWMNQWFHWWGI